MTAASISCLLSFILSTSSSLGLPPALDISRLESTEPGCSSDLGELRRGLDNGELWAQTMWDAGVKSPVGVLSQTAVQFGDFDECLSLSQGSPVSPQFCLVNVSPQWNSSSWLPLSWGVCVPSSCSAQELRTSMQAYMDNETTSGDAVIVDVIPETCTTSETASRSITLADVIFCVVFSSIVLVVCLATFHDMRLRPHYDGVSSPRTVSQCLSARYGLYSLFRADQQISGVNLNSLYGLHTCAFFFVVMGHRFGVHLFFMSLTNYRSVEHMFVSSWFSIWAGHMDLFVDIFFFMSAFLLSLFYYTELHKRFINPFMVYLLRLCRIVPTYALVVFFYATLLRQLGDGPLWNKFMDAEQSKCRDYWWTNLLFINNYVESNNMCILQSWYITCDFQLFVCGTVLVFLLQQSPRPGISITAVVFLLSTLAPFLGTYLYDRPATLLFFKDFWVDPRHHDMFLSVYTQSHYRGTSYLMGLLAGCYVYRHRKEPLSKGRTYTLQAVGTACSLLVYWSGSLFYDLTQPPSRLVAALYAASYHTIFGLSMALFVVSCTLGKNSYVTRLLSWEGFVPLSKLSFCVYLVHNIPQFVWIASSRTTVYLNPLELVSWSIADVVISLAISIILCLTVETPFRYLIKHYVSGSPSSTILPQNTEPQEKYIIQDSYNVNYNKSTPSN